MAIVSGFAERRNSPHGLPPQSSPSLALSSMQKGGLSELAVTNERPEIVIRLYGIVAMIVMGLYRLMEKMIRWDDSRLETRET